MSQCYSIGTVAEWYSNQKYRISDLNLKPMQIAIINCNTYFDVLVNLPTGFGKSILFQYPASKLTNQCIIIFVPLRALLWDSIKQAQKFGISAAQVNDQTIQKYKKDHKILQMYFLTPQKLFINQNTRSFVQTLHEMNKIRKFVIDQAHCVSQWGSDFRPHYLQLAKLRGMFPGVNILAMSATIPPQARQDLIKRLNMKNCRYFQASYNRPNLTYLIRQTAKNDLTKTIKSFLSEQNLFQECGIIYCQTIKYSQQVAQQLEKLGLKCALFHSKISQKKRWNIFKQFMNQQIKIIVATICFGMGVNKKNIRYVINAGISMSMENYYQQSGRAGRDGKLAFCLLLSYNKDQYPLIFLTQQSVKDKKIRQRKLIKIQKMKEYVKSIGCRKNLMFANLGQKFTEIDCNKTCDFCLNKEIFQSKFQIVQLDVTQDSKKIINELIKNKNEIYFTKIQLSQYLKGKQICKKGYNFSLGNQIKGIFKNKSDQFVQEIINKLINLNLLVLHKKKGKFQKFVKYYKVCRNLNQLYKITKIEISSKTARPGKSVQHPADRFQKFISAKKLRKQQIFNQSDLQMKQVNKDKILKNQSNISFLQELFQSQNQQNKQSESQQNTFQQIGKQDLWKDKLKQIKGSCHAIQISSDEEQLKKKSNKDCQQGQFEQSQFADEIDNYLYMDQHENKNQTQSQVMKELNEVQKQTKLYEPMFTNGDNINIYQRKSSNQNHPVLKQKTTFQYLQAIKKLKPPSHQTQIHKIQVLKKQPSILQYCSKIERPKPKNNKKIDFI